MFMCNKWLAVDRDDGAIERLLPAATEKDVANFEYLFFTTTQKVEMLFLFTLYPLSKLHCVQWIIEIITIFVILVYKIVLQSINPCISLHQNT